MIAGEGESAGFGAVDIAEGLYIRWARNGRRIDTCAKIGQIITSVFFTPVMIAFP